MEGPRAGLAYVDITTGEFAATTELKAGMTWKPSSAEELGRHGPG
jgi:hypothetical protein